MRIFDKIKITRKYLCSLLLVSSLFAFFSCGNKTETIKNKKNVSQPKVEMQDDINGYWILANFQDSAISERTIAKYRMLRPFWNSYIMEITNDSIFITGSIHCDRFKRTKNYDSLGKTDRMVSLKFRYDSTNNRIFATEVLSGYEEDDKYAIRYPLEYRRLLTKEKQLLLRNKEPNLLHTYDLGNNLTTYYTKAVMQGKYVLKSNKKKVLILKADGTCSGFKDFNQFKVDNYFGTCHSFDNHDMIFFTKKDSTGEYQEYYAWKFKGNDFILTKMEPESPNTIDYAETKIVYVFRKLITLKI